MTVSNNIISRCVLSQKFEEEDGSNKFGELTRKLTMLLMGFCFGDMYPYLRWLDVLTGFIPGLKAISGEFDSLFDQKIEEHKALQSHDELTNKKDFVSIILEVQKDCKLDMELTQDNIKAILLDMFSAGTDSNSIITEWLMAELLKHPNIMKKAQEEVRNVVGEKSKIDLDDINKMEYLKCVLKETFRLHPPSPFLLRRILLISCKLGGYDIPSNTTVMVNLWVIQRDPNWWENPEEFIPERFENNHVDFHGQDFQFIPFGCGRRSYPGLPFAIVSIHYMIATLLHWFDWKLPAGQTAENLDMSEVFGLNVSKKVPLCVLPISRLSV